MSFDWYLEDGVKPSIRDIWINKAGAGWRELRMTDQVSVGTTDYLARGGDGYSMLAGLHRVNINALDYQIIASYLQAVAPAPPGLTFPESDRITQAANVDLVQIGLVCTAMAGPSRSSCDHIRHTVDAINDHADGFLDRVLTHTKLELNPVSATVVSDCSGNASQAYAALAAELPRMVAVLGFECAEDVEVVSRDQNRQTYVSSPDAIVMTAVASSSFLSDDRKYPNVARTVTSNDQKALSVVALMKTYGWSRVVCLVLKHIPYLSLCVPPNRSHPFE